MTEQNRDATKFEEAAYARETTMTLQDYANDREGVIIFFAGTADPAGDHTVAGYPDLDFAERRSLFDLTGTVDANGDWHWDGKGKPTDDRANTIYKVHAYVDAGKWAAIVEEYENG
jgi:hypothetical protein